MKVMCVEKNRNAVGAIVEYVLCDEYGNTCYLNRDGMVKILKDKDYDVLNLQLDKMGRIVEKSMNNEKSMIEQLNKKSESTAENAIFERAYGLFKHQQMIVMVVQNGKVLLLDEPFNLVTSINANNIDQFMSQFEGYLKNKYNYTPAKLEVINKARNWRYIMYGEQYIECTIMHKQNYYPGLSNIKDFIVNTNMNDANHHLYSKTASLYDKETSRIVENAFCGAIVYDKRCKEAAEWANKQIKELENKVNSMSKNNRKGFKFGNSLLSKH